MPWRLDLGPHTWLRSLVKRARLLAVFAFTRALAAALTALFLLAASERTGLAAGPDPAAEAQALLTKLEAPATREVVQDPVAKAKAAQQRAQSARGAGDLQHATELDALALTWAQVADDLRKTAAAEKQLADVQKAVADLEQKAVRIQALIEQTIARRGRAEQNLKSLPAVPAASATGAPTSKPNKEPKSELTPTPPKPAAPAAAKV